MSATTYFTRKEELSYTDNSRLVQETEIWAQDGGEFALSALSLTGDTTSGLVDLEDLVSFAKAEGLEDLEAVFVAETKRENLDSTDYEVFISY